MPLCVQIHATVLGEQEAGRVTTIAVDGRVVFLVIDAEMAVGSTEHVLFLSDSPLDIRPAMDIGVSHVENGEAPPILRGHGAGDLAPINRQDLDTKAFRRLGGFLTPACEVSLGEAMVGSRRIGLMEGLECLSQHRLSALAFVADEPSGFGRVVATEDSS